MRNSPCLNCPYRKATCHDYCREYLDYHEERLSEKEQLTLEKLAIHFLMESALKREKRAKVRR